MEVFYTPEKKENLSLALGFFDGIHKGHQKVIESAVNAAKKNNLKSAVVSFEQHPSCLLLKRNPEYIIPLEDKIKKLEKLGVDYLYLLTFDEKFSQLSKEDYVEYLIKMTNPKIITTGFNHFFGKNREGNTEFLNKTCKEKNIVYKKIEPIKIKNLVVSSSAIRKFLLCGNVEKAKEMLEYDFYIKGEVIDGMQLGSKLGFKTINVEYPEKIIKLPFGVYCTKVNIDGEIFNSVTNWGVNPTVSGENIPIAETHILNFDKNIYGKKVKIDFLTKIRNEKKFDTLDALKKQISKDVEFCKNYLSD